MRVSSQVPVCLGAVPIPAHTHEMGHYPVALEEVVEAYASIDLFRRVMYFIFLAVVLDAFSRPIVGWSMAGHL